MHLLGTRAQAGVFILHYVELDLQISVHVLDLFRLLFEHWRLVSLSHSLVPGRRGLVVDQIWSLRDDAGREALAFAAALSGLGGGSTAEEDVSRTVVVDDLLDDLPTRVATFSCTSWHLLAIVHGLDWHEWVLLELRRLEVTSVVLALPVRVSNESNEGFRLTVTTQEDRTCSV